MTDLQALVEHLVASADEDWQVASQLRALGKLRHALFFAHLASEKLLKARIASALRELPPRVHNLPRLAEIGQVSL